MNSKQQRMNMENYIHSKLECNSQLFSYALFVLYKVFKMNQKWATAIRPSVRPSVGRFRPYQHTASWN